MATMGSKSGMQEWREHWPLPLAAMVGYSAAGLPAYALGVFMEPLQAEFGWTRTEIGIGLTIAGLTSAVMAVPVGMLVDRVGPRIVGLCGIVAMTCAFALLATATGTMANWIMLWSLIAIAGLGLHGTVWTMAVASRFDRARGLAFAVTLSGTPLTATVLPVIATALIVLYDWRVAFAGVALIWFVVAFSLMLPFFRSAHEGVKRALATPAQQPSPVLKGMTFAEATRTWDFYKLLAACGLFAFTVLGLIVHFVPILTGQGTGRMAAAGIAALVGISAIVGRIGTGFLLDRLPSHLVGAAAFLLPVISCLLLLFDGANPTSQIIAAVLFGLTVGAEMDVIAYLSSRRFGMANYGTIFGAMLAALSLGASFGPLAAGMFYDSFSGYAEFLWLTITAMILSALALVTMSGRTASV